MGAGGSAGKSRIALWLEGLGWLSGQKDRRGLKSLGVVEDVECDIYSVSGLNVGF